MKKITLIFLLFANMIASGQISKIIKVNGQQTTDNGVFFIEKEFVKMF